MRLADLSDDEVRALPVERLAMVVLNALIDRNDWSAHNFKNDQQHAGRRESAMKALIEALGWLTSHNLVAYGHPTQSSSEAIMITRAGQVAAAEGLGTMQAEQRLVADLDRRLGRARTQFLLGEFEAAAFLAMREVEIAVRKKIRAPDSLIGTKLTKHAFNPENGPLSDVAIDLGERVGLMELYSGALATFRNPVSHRDIDYGDPIQASEVVLFADLLLRMLDRMKVRRGGR